MENPGKYRNQEVGVFQGSRVAHMAPPAENVAYLMNDLFGYLKRDEDLTLIQSGVFHYEMEFIHPFLHGNGRVGILWQTVILLNEYPVFEFLPFETLISQTQHDYYDALGKSDREGNLAIFTEYMLSVIEKSLTDLLDFNSRIFSDIDRLEHFIALGKKKFSPRKDYMNVFKDISSAPTSRNLKKGARITYV